MEIMTSVATLYIKDTVLLFFNMGPVELLVVVFVILMFFGSESIPKIARGLGRGMRQVRDAAEEIKQDIRDSANDVHKEIEASSVQDDEPAKAIESPQVDEPTQTNEPSGEIEGEDNKVAGDD